MSAGLQPSDHKCSLCIWLPPKHLLCKRFPCMALCKVTLSLRVAPSLVRALVTVYGGSLRELEWVAPSQLMRLLGLETAPPCVKARRFPLVGAALLKEDLTLAPTGPFAPHRPHSRVQQPISGQQARGWRHSGWISDRAEVPFLPGALSSRLAVPMHSGQNVGFPRKQKPSERN